MAALTRLPLHRASFWLLLVFIGGGVAAQDRSPDPVPTWPKNGQIPLQYRDRYVFLTDDKHTVVVLAPERPDTGITGPKQVIRVPLWNNIVPLVSASLTRASGVIEYKYRIENSKEAQDPIGKFSLIVPARVSDLKIRHVATKGGAPWAGAAAYVAIAQQVTLQRSPGRYLTWFYQGDNVVQPGSTLDGFVIESSYLPGLTTAWFSAGRLVEFDQSWPREIFLQLHLLEDRRWYEASAITVGPTFPPDTPKEAMIESFRQDLEQLIKSGSLSASSEFVKEAFGVLNELRRNPSGRPVLKVSPQIEIEAAFTAALAISFGISERSPQ